MAATTPPKKERKVYPLDITGLDALLKSAQRKTKIKSRAVLMQMAIERGLPVLIQQLSGMEKAA